MPPPPSRAPISNRHPAPSLTCAPHTCRARRVNTSPSPRAFPGQMRMPSLACEFCLLAWLARLARQRTALRHCYYCVRARGTTGDRRRCSEPQGNRCRCYQPLIASRQPLARQDLARPQLTSAFANRCWCSLSRALQRARRRCWSTCAPWRPDPSTFPVTPSTEQSLMPSLSPLPLSSRQRSAGSVAAHLCALKTHQTSRGTAPRTRRGVCGNSHIILPCNTVMNDRDKKLIRSTGTQCQASNSIPYSTSSVQLGPRRRGNGSEHHPRIPLICIAITVDLYCLLASNDK